MDTIRVDGEIVLRQVAGSDADRLYRLIETDRTYVEAWLPWVESICTLDDEREWAERMARVEDGDREQPYAIVYDGAVVGGIGIILEPMNHAGEIGYWLAEAMQGRGIATRACEALLDHAFRSRGLHRVLIRAALENRRSRAIPERLGFVLEGTERESLYANGRHHDTAVYSMLAPEWTARKR